MERHYSSTQFNSALVKPPLKWMINYISQKTTAVINNPYLNLN